MTALAVESRDLALDLYGLLRQIDPPRWRDEMEHACRDQLARIHRRIAALLDAPWAGATAIRDRLVDLQALLLQNAPPAGRAGWRQLHRALQPAYERLADSLREWDVHVPALRPSNPARSLMHVTAGIGVVTLVELALYEQWRMLIVAGGAAAIAWTLEVTRRTRPRWNEVLMRAFGPTSHPHERYRVNSATWYTTALFFLALLGSLPVGVLAVIVLGVADPVAAIVGRRFGRVRLLNGRTLEGTLAFVAAGLVAGLALLRFVHPEIASAEALAMALAAAVAGGLAELFARRVDDNLAIPVAAGLAGWTASILI